MPKELGTSRPLGALGNALGHVWVSLRHAAGKVSLTVWGQQVRRDRIQSACEKALRGGGGLGRWLQRMGVGTDEAVPGLGARKKEGGGQAWDQSEAGLGRGLLTH